MAKETKKGGAKAPPKKKSWFERNGLTEADATRRHNAGVRDSQNTLKASEKKESKKERAWWDTDYENRLEKNKEYRTEDQEKRYGKKDSPKRPAGKSTNFSEQESQYETLTGMIQGNKKDPFSVVPKESSRFSVVPETTKQSQKKGGSKSTTSRVTAEANAAAKAASKAKVIPTVVGQNTRNMTVAGGRLSIKKSPVGVKEASTVREARKQKKTAKKAYKRSKKK